MFHDVGGVVFDLWNTLVHNDGPTNPLFASLRLLGIADYHSGLEAFEAVFMTREFPSFASAARELQKTFHCSDQVRERLTAIWKEADATLRVYPDVASTLEALRPEYRLAIASNTQTLDLGPLRASGFFDSFDVVCLSSECGLLKPDPRMYLHVAEQLGLPPNQLLMIGDSVERDVKPAASVGYHTLLLRRSSPDVPDEMRLPVRNQIRSLTEVPLVLKA